MINVHYIKSLSKKQIKIHTFFRCILLVFVIIFLIYFFKELLFPIEHFLYSNKKPHQNNTISSPYITKNGTSFDIATYGDFHNASITFTLDDKEHPLQKDTKINAKKSYASFLLPQLSTDKYKNDTTTFDINHEKYFIQLQNTISQLTSKNALQSYIFSKKTFLQTTKELPQSTNLTENVIAFAPATLFSIHDAIYVSDYNNIAHKFENEIAFIQMGYNFNNVLKATDEELRIYNTKSLYSFKNSHPSDTLFYAIDTKKMYLYDKNQLYKIETNAKLKQHAIAVMEQSRITTSICTIKKKLFSKNTYTCTIPLHHIKKFPGNMYQFTITTPNVSLKQAHIKLNRTKDQFNLRERLAHFKREIIYHYTQQKK